MNYWNGMGKHLAALKTATRYFHANSGLYRDHSTWMALIQACYGLRQPQLLQEIVLEPLYRNALAAAAAQTRSESFDIDSWIEGINGLTMCNILLARDGHDADSKEISNSEGDESLQETSEEAALLDADDIFALVNAVSLRSADGVFLLPEPKHPVAEDGEIFRVSKTSEQTNARISRLASNCAKYLEIVERKDLLGRLAAVRPDSEIEVASTQS